MANESYIAQRVKELRNERDTAGAGSQQQSYIAQRVREIRQETESPDRDALKVLGTGGTVDAIRRLGTLSGRYSEALDSYQDTPAAEPHFSLDALDDQASAGEKYVTYNDWLESGTEAESTRRRNLLGTLSQLEKVVAQDVYSGRQQLTGTLQELTDQRLMEQGYTPEEIAEARRMAEYYDGMTLYDVGRRIGQTAKGTAVTVGSFIPQLLDYSVQRAKNLAQREKTRAEMLESQEPEWLAPEEALARNAEREETLREADLPVSQDTLGYQIYQSGQAALEDAMRGETAAQQFLHGAATSAAENLALAAINPALVLPALTMQGAADNLAEATASGKDISHAVTSAGIKAGVGWIIEEAGVAQMAQNMGKQFAASALSQNILNFINSAPGMSALQESAPVLYGVVASGMDEAVEEFVESYANKLVDVALGDAAADDLLSLEQLAEAGMGAAGGALGGAMIGGVSSAIGTMGRARQAQTELRPDEVANQQLSDAVQQAAQVGAVQQVAQPAEQLAPDTQQTEVRPAAEPAVQPPAAQAQQTGLLDAFLEGGRLEGPAWEALRAQQTPAAQEMQTQERPAEAIQAQSQEQRQAERMIEREAWNEVQQEQAWLLESETRMSEAAVNVAVEAMPEGVSGEVYSAAANTLYRLARSGIAEDVEDALQLASKNGVRVGQVLAAPGGESALRQIYNQGKLEGLEADEYGRPGLAPENQAGTVTYEPGTQIPEEDRALIDIFAAASDTAVTVKEKLENSASGYIETALGKIVFGAEAGTDTFGTILHESNHLYNALDPEGGRALQNTLLRYLAEQRGFEEVENLIESYIQRYQDAGENLSYAQACEEVVNDALRGAFDSKESITRWVEKQNELAQQNPEQRSMVAKAMEAVRQLLDKIIERAKDILSADPANKAARRAQTLAEEQKRVVQDMYFSHAETAVQNERAMRSERQGGQAAGQTAEQTGRRAAQLRENAGVQGKANARRTEYPQAGWTGKGDAAYDTLAALPDMEITPIDTRAVEGKNYREIVADAFENMGAGRTATKATVSNRYTGMEIAIDRKSIEHSFHTGSHARSRGPYVEQIGSILENAVKVNELEGRTGPKGRGEDHSDVYLGAAENEKGELVGVRLIVNVYENGRAELDTASLAEETGKLYAHLGTKIGSAEAPPAGAHAIYVASDRTVSRAPLQGPRASTAEAEPSHTISIADLVGTVNKTERVEGSRNMVNWLEGVLSEDVRQRLESNVSKSADVADSLRYQLPVDNTPAESGQKAAAWENVDRTAIEKELEAAYESGANQIPVENIKSFAQKLLRTEQSKANQITIAKKLERLAAYLSGGQVDGNAAFAMAEDIAETIMQKSGRMDRELWEQYPDLHYHTVFVRRGGTEYKELLYRYGDYATAQKELAKFGIKVTTGEAHADSGIDQVYQALSSDYGELFPADITGSMEQLDRIAQIREMIKPKIQNNYGENWEEAKADLAMRILGGLVSEGVTDKTVARLLNQRIDEGLNRHRTEIRLRVTKALGDLERSNRLAARKDAQRIVNQAAEGNRRRAEAWAKMNRNQRVALAQSKDALQRARNARSADATRRAIAANVTKLNRMILHPSEKYHISVGMIRDVLRVAELANNATRNEDALTKIRAKISEIQSKAEADNGADGLAGDWENSGINEMLKSLAGSMEARARRNARLDQQEDAAARRVEQGLDILYGTQDQQAELAEAAQTEGEEIVLRLDKLTPEQMNLLRDITSAVLTVVQNQNKLLATQTAQKASEFAAVAIKEVENSRKRIGRDPSILQKLELKYNLNVLNPERVFVVLGGYKHNGAMEILAKSLAAGEAKQTAVKEKGVRIFSNVLDGKENQSKLRKFAGPDAELVDVGLIGGAKVNHAQAVSLWMHLQHEQNAEHILRGGVKVPDMELYARGDMERAYSQSKVERFKVNHKQEYAIQIQGIREKIESVLDEYDWMWIEDLQELFENYTKTEINKTSRMLSGYDKATVEKYFPLSVDPVALRKEIDELVFNGTIEGRGFLKERKQHAAQPVLLEECSQAAMRSLADTAAYAGLAPAIRDFNKIWNAARDEGGGLEGAIQRNFDAEGVQYVKDYISDLQQRPRDRKSMLNALNSVRGRYAGAVLNLNPKVIMGQVSGVFGAGSELGGKATAAAFEYMAKRMAGRFDKGEDMRIRQEMMDHGFWGLESTLSDGPTAEIAELRKRRDKISQLTQKLPLANALEYMDKLTREGIWEGAKTYVQEHLSDYDLTEADMDSEEYWAAVVTKATETINRTQPNYTVSQLAAIQRDPNQLAKIMTMFKTQGFQNYGVLQYAVEDYRAQKQNLEAATQNAERTDLTEKEAAEAKAALELAQKENATAEQRLKMALGAQATQALFYAVITTLVSALTYHKLDDLKDEEGKITALSASGKIVMDTLQSATVDNVFLLPEALGIIGNLVGYRDSDPISLTGIDAFADLGSDFYGVYQMVTSGELDLLDAADKITDLAGSAFNLVGLPVSQVKRLLVGVAGWTSDAVTAIRTEGVSLGDVINMPTSSSQYDDLYTAVFETENPEDAADAMEALEKLDKLNPPKKPGDAKAGDTKILSEMLKREKEFGTLIQDAAAARISGDNATQQKLMQQLVNTLADALGIDQKTKEGQRRLTTVINKVNTAISDEMRAQMGADSSTGATIYTPVLNALETGSGLSEALSVLRRAGIQDSDIRSAVQTAYKEDYLYADDAGREAIKKKLLSLKNAEGEAYFTEANLAGWVMDWELKGFNDSVYTDLDEALQTRNRVTAQEEIYRYMNAGKDAGSIRDRISALYRDVYLAAGPAERQELARFLVGLRSPKGEKLVSTDTLIGWIKDEAKKN